MNIKILYEDDHLLVIDKPAGMVVNRAETVKGETVQDWAEKKLDIKKMNLGDTDLFVKRSGVAHRLDKETSGCLLIAKKPVVLEKLLAEFKNRQVHKEYLALVHGRLEPREGVMKLPIGRDRWERKRRKVAVDGKVAETAWRVEQYRPNFSLIRLWPKTGRTHQIRVHMAHLGHPLVGDSLYLNKKRSEADRLIYRRHFLHAAGLSFKHPVTGQTVRVESQLPDDLRVTSADKI